MGATETNTISRASAPWDFTELTASQWRELESHLTDEERATLQGLRKQWINAAELLAVWLDPVLRESDMSFERALAAVQTAETEFHAYLGRLRRQYSL